METIIETIQSLYTDIEYHAKNLGRALGKAELQFEMIEKKLEKETSKQDEQ